MQQVTGRSGSSNFVIDPGVSWPVQLMSLTPLIQEFKTLLQNGFSKQQQGRCQDKSPFKIHHHSKKIKNSAHSMEETQLRLSILIHKNKSQNSCTAFSARGQSTIRAIGGGKQRVEAANGTINHICEG